MCWSFVYAWIVVMKPCSIVNSSCSTLASGATQLVVHEAFEITWCAPGRSVVVHPEDHRHVGALGGRGDHHLLGASVEVLRGAVAVGEEAGRLDHHVHAEIAPGQIAGVALRQDLELLAIDGDRAVAHLDVLAERAEDGVDLSRCAIVAASPRSLAATTSKSPPRWRCDRKKLRPIRPKPLIPTRIATYASPSLTARVYRRSDARLAARIGRKFSDL